ncbi:MAG: hypothetical protein HYW49_06390 [Deltaproteobacteria bacterium]|nr:hypothetical protein [Deltaproteobacteria bacterium]
MKIIFSFFAVTIFLFLSLSFEARAAESCKPLYLEAAQALDEDRAKCGLDKRSGLAVCTIIAAVDEPLSSATNGISFIVMDVYRLLTQWHLIPNRFRRVARLIDQAEVGKGLLLKSAYKSIRKKNSGVTIERVAQAIRDEDASGGLCAQGRLLSIAQVENYITEKLK